MFKQNNLPLTFVLQQAKERIILNEVSMGSGVWYGLSNGARHCGIQVRSQLSLCLPRPPPHPHAVDSQVERQNWVKVEALNARGKKVKKKYTDWTARIFQVIRHSILRYELGVQFRFSAESTNGPNPSGNFSPKWITRLPAGPLECFTRESAPFLCNV